MSRIRVLVGTRKGGFVLNADGKRSRWKVDGPHFPGWEVFHMKRSPVDPDRIYASQTSSWFGQIIQRSNDRDTVYAGVEDAALFKSTDGGDSWHEVSGNLPRARSQDSWCGRCGGTLRA